MTNGILVNKAVNYILSNDETITSYVGDQIFPLLIPINPNDDINKIKFPLIVFARTAINPRYCKDGCYEDEITVQIVVCDKDYFRGCTIADAVREAFEWKRGTIQDINIAEIKLSGVSEATENNIFLQTLTFTLKVG